MNALSAPRSHGKFLERSKVRKGPCAKGCLMFLKMPSLVPGPQSLIFDRCGCYSTCRAPHSLRGGFSYPQDIPHWNRRSRPRVSSAITSHRLPHRALHSSWPQGQAFLWVSASRCSEAVSLLHLSGGRRPCKCPRRACCSSLMLLCVGD